MIEKLRILLIDDNRDDRELAARALKRELGDVECIEINDAESLQATLAAGDFQVVITDYQLRWTDGLAVLREILARHPQIPVIMFTNTGTEEVCAEAMKLGLFEYIVKTPRYYSKLPSAVCAALDSMTMKRELARHQEENDRQRQRLQELFDSERKARAEAETAAAALRESVAELQRAQTQLAEAARHKDQFLAMLAHELRNPLAALRIAADTMQLLKLNDPQLTRLRNMIDRQVTHLDRMLADLLDVSRIARGKIYLQKQRMDLTKIVHETVEDFRPTLEHKGLSLALETPPEPMWIDADPARLTQILGNLLDNAHKFTASGGTVTVSLQPEAHGGVALLSVRDTGIGFEPHLAGMMFDPFRQADASLDRRRGGLGLGLSLVKGLVDLHGGEVWAFSEGPDHGTEFKIRLPLERPFPSAQENVEAQPAAASLRILIIEDLADTAYFLQTLLELLGHEAAVAQNGKTGLETARGFLPQVLLCDIGLPDMNGYEVARAVRADKILCATVLVAMTGYGQEKDQREAAEAGFDLHLTKPVTLEQLQQVLAEAGSRSEQSELN